MSDRDPTCPCCGQRWLDPNGFAILCNTFVSPKGATHLTNKQRTLLMELRKGRKTGEELAAAAKVSAVYDFKQRLRPVFSDLNGYLDWHRWKVRWEPFGEDDFIYYLERK